LDAQREETRNEAGHRTKERVAGPGMTDGLTADTILLGGESEGHKGDGMQFVRGPQERVDAAIANPALDVLNAKKVIM
jgi:hypothetical protein